ncbi:uncharacterized protein LOC142237772 [Haematobia irritans]|uniref:uncharacterized protein LOC142237772 n=1 Tax=Haematobia irritans TaxID=7368 RepID=UPI003F50C3C8
MSLKIEIENATFKITPKRTPKAWWNDSVERLYRLRQAAQKRFDFCKSSSNAENLQQAIANLRNAIKFAKRKSFTSKIDHLNTNPNSKSLFKFVRGCKNYSFTDTSSNWSEDNNNKFLNNLVEKIPNNITSHTRLDHFEVTEDFTLLEFFKILKEKNKPSAAGLDGITYEMVKNLSEEAKRNLLTALNKAWAKCEINEEWRKIKIIPIPKRGKDLTDITNFRPIALLPVLLKILNLMMKNRLNDFLIKNNVLPHRSYAYQKHKSAASCVNDLLHSISVYKEKGEKTIIMTLDVSTAYECVDINILTNIMLNLNFPQHIIAWIHSFLSRRTLIMGKNSIDIFNGIPQGSCLSPTLFNIYTLGLHGVADENTDIYQFADDFIILSHAKEFNNATSILQNKALEFNSLLKQLKLQVNIEKTAVMYVAKGARNIPLISLGGRLIRPLNSIKFLGRTINNSLSLRDHFNDVSSSCKSSLNALKMLTSLNNGLHPTIANNVTKSIIFSKTEYLVSSMANAPKYLDTKIRSFQNQILKRNMGLTKDTPTHIVYALAGITPPKQRAQYLAAKELLNLKIYNVKLYEHITGKVSKNTSMGMVYLKFKNILDQTKVNNYIPASSKIQIRLNVFPFNKNTYNSTCLLALYRKEMNELKGEGYCIWATDASVNENSTGCAACNISTNENFLFQIQAKVSSLTGELHALNKAIDIIIEDGIDKAAIFTDSKNACILMRNNTAHNYMINDIINKVNNSSLSQIVIVWTPSHVGIQPNELADYYAKHAATDGSIINSNFSIKDAQHAIKDCLWKEWKEEYQSISLHKGTYFYQFFNEPPKNPWYKDSSLTPPSIKLINRLLSGHTYSKHFLFNMRLIDSNICETCNALENEHHLIFHCNKFEQTRKNYIIFKKFSNLPTLLKNAKTADLNELISFININNINL